MLEEWMFKTILAFMSMQAITIVFKKYLVILFKNKNKKPTGTFRALLNGLLLSMIPVLRWFFVGILLLAVFMGIAIDEENK